MYGSESWTKKKADSRRIDVFELCCWRRLLRVPLTARRSNQSILKEISPKYSLDGLMLKLKLQYFGHLRRRTDSFEDPDAGKDWEQEEKGTTEDEMVGWHHWLNGHDFKEAPGIGDGQGGLVCCSPWGCRQSDTTERLKWTELSMALAIRTRPSFPHSQFLPSGSFHKPFILIHQRANRKPQSQKTNQTDHMDHSLV